MSEARPAVLPMRSVVAMQEESVQSNPKRKGLRLMEVVEEEMKMRSRGCLISSLTVFLMMTMSLKMMKLKLFHWRRTQKL